MDGNGKSVGKKLGGTGFGCFGETGKPDRFYR